VISISLETLEQILSLAADINFKLEDSCDVANPITRIGAVVEDADVGFQIKNKEIKHVVITPLSLGKG